MGNVNGQTTNDYIPRTGFKDRDKLDRKEAVLDKGIHIKELRAAIEKLSVQSNNVNNCGNCTWCQGCQTCQGCQACQGCQTCQLGKCQRQCWTTPTANCIQCVCKCNCSNCGDDRG